MGVQKLILGLLVFGFCLPARATPLPHEGLIVFSSLCTDRMTNDLNGDRLVLVRLPLHDFGYMEGGDGGFNSASLDDLKIDDPKGTVFFRYRDSEGRLKTVASTISAESVGLTSWDGKPFQLRRLWKVAVKLPVCQER
jgi:hypothetical protein